MNKRKQRLIMEQTDQKLKSFAGLVNVSVPEGGWINTIRKSLNMSLRQLAARLKVSPQAVKAMERREKNGTISLKSLRDTARALNMHVVYGLMPNEGSLEEMVNNRAMEIARIIVNRASQNMKLEDQENSNERIMRAFEEKQNELKNEMPKFLWD